MAGTQRAKIAAEISAIQSEYYGKGPLRSKTYWQDDLVCVVLEETFTQAEKTLIRQGEIEPIRDIRRRFQQVVADQFISVIEQATGRKVRVFVSETDVESDVSVEIFLLETEDSRTDMRSFEP